MTERNNRKVRIGIVTKDKMDKTVVVAIDSHAPHPLYNKIAKHTKHYKVHDENNEARVGDRVKIMETRPLSKTKRWRLEQIIERADIV